MNDAVTKINLSESPSSITTVRMPDYTGILPSQKIKEMLDSGEIKAFLRPIDNAHTKSRFCLSMDRL